jgi:hypothetical protein
MNLNNTTQLTSFVFGRRHPAKTAMLATIKYRDMKTTVITLTIMTLALFSSAQSKVDAKCKLWTPTNFCDTSETLNLPYLMYGTNCTEDVRTCQQMEDKNLIGVHITFSSKTDSTFSLKSKFKNISLKKKSDGKVIRPYAIKWYGVDYDSKTGKLIPFLGYLLNNLKARTFVVKYNLNTTYDLIILFKSAEQGDQIVIDNFIDVKIE